MLLNWQRHLKFSICVLLSWTLHRLEHKTSSEAGSYPVSQEIPCVVWTRKVHITYTRACHQALLSQINPIHAHLSSLLKIHFSIIPSMSRSSKCYLPFSISDQNYVWFLSFSTLATCPIHLILPDLFNLMVLGEKKLWSSSLCCCCHFLSLRSKYSLRILFLETLTLCPLLETSIVMGFKFQPLPTMEKFQI